MSDIIYYTVCILIQIVIRNISAEWMKKRFFNFILGKMGFQNTHFEPINFEERVYVR